MFITLTYNDEHVPKDYALHKKEIQGFFKRLRSSLEYDKGTFPIKYYACGEYGDDLTHSPVGVLHGRPHFHAIIFGLSPYNDEHVRYCIDAWQHRCDDWHFDRNRGKKRAVQPVTPDDISYVTGYVQKKLSGMYADIFYGDAQKPFAVMSKGLGLDFALQNAHRLRTNGFTYLSGHKISLPRYYREKLDITPDYDNAPKLTKEEYTKLYEHTKKEYEKYCEIKQVHFDLSTAKGLMLASKHFQDFLDKHEYAIANQAYRDFQQRQKLRNKGL